jgi:transcriptional regulator with PAS, ATPase and Fis domain
MASSLPFQVGQFARLSARLGERAIDTDIELIGTSPAMVDLDQEIERVADREAKVLITGESGVGKELVAQSIHNRSPRHTRPFVTVNCAGLPETLLESELFGHVKGSFTGAYRDKPGKLEVAHQGTVFLDEIGEMSLRMQGMLLRFLETGELQKVGSDGAAATMDVRVITATNRNLPEMIGQGQFRKDLFYRLNVIHLHVPPLRERREDIPLLVDHFFGQLGHPNGNGNGHANSNGHQQIAPEALAALTEYSWPGNVRELENVIERLAVGRRDVIGLDDLPLEVRTQRGIAFGPKRERRRTVADDLLKKMLEKRASFWTAVYPLYMQREITRGNIRDLVRKGLEESRGNYRIVTKLFNMDPRDYKKFLNFLRKHQCLLPFKEYR